MKDELPSKIPKRTFGLEVRLRLVRVWEIFRYPLQTSHFRVDEQGRIKASRDSIEASFTSHPVLVSIPLMLNVLKDLTRRFRD